MWLPKEFKKRYTTSLRKHIANYILSLPRAENSKALPDGKAKIGKESQSLNHHMEERPQVASISNYNVNKK